MRGMCPSASKQFPTLTLLAAIVCTLSFHQPSSAQQQTALTAPRPLITQPVDETQLSVLKGNTHPLARPQVDLGTAPATLPMQRMLLVLRRSPEQESALRQLLDNQQDKSSPNYHKWLTPEEYGKQFGPTDADMQTITAWLQSHGFQVGSAKGRTVLEFSGSASQVQQAFHTTIHKYIVNGEQHWANSNDPSIPTALTPAVAGVASMNNFRRKAMNQFVGRFARNKKTGTFIPVSPLYTYQPNFQCSADNYCFAVGPYDFATIYNVLPLWDSNINGTGQTIAIVGESNINPQDVADFRSLFGLPANSTATGNPLNIILNGPDPGPQGDESEADIDVQWSGAVAPYAAIDFVVSQSTETTTGTDLSAVYIVENNLAGVMSESYGLCELGLGTTGNQFYNSLWQQAAAQGITVFIAAGDNGSAGCDAFGVHSPAPAQFGLAVSGYASTPYNVAVGGTDFNEFTSPQTYWSTTNTSTTQASALGYVPETTWNDSCTNAIWETVPGLSQSPEINCNNTQLNDDVPNGGSGGASNCTTPTGSAPANCAGGYPKPSWQTGTGVPNDNKRDLPDVSLFASNGFAGSFYVICQSDQTGGACNLNNQEFLGFGGTSVSSPAFAGIMALVNQQTGARQGNANYVFYKLAAKHTLSTCNASSNPASTCIFNDVTSGTIAMPCAVGSPNCNTSPGDQYGILTGYNAGTGYDQATGLGSVNANNLVTQWSSVTTLPSTTTLNSLAPTTITHGQTVNFSVTVTPKSGTGTPTGLISLLGGPSNSDNQGIGGFSLSSGSFSGTTALLPGGTYSVTAHYPGDSTYAASASGPISVTVGKENSLPQVFLVTFDSNGNLINGNTNMAVYGSPYILRVNVENSAGAMCTPVSATAATACPSGTVAMTNNGATLDASTYTLNSYGYFEDFAVQLPGGTNSVKAAYAGDNSFNPSSSTTPITITPDSTTLSTPFFRNGAYAGQSTLIESDVFTTTTSGIAPTGTVSFNVNGTAVGGTVTYSPRNGELQSPAYLGAVLNSNANAFPAPGKYTVAASYSGDANYAASPSSATNITVQYPPPNMTLTPVQQTVMSGGAATLTAFVDSSNQSVYPTGTVSLVGNFRTVAGPVPCTSTKDASGNYACQGTLTFVPSATIFLYSNYSGDTNYPTQNSGGVSEVDVPDFALSPGAGQVTMTQGQSQTVAINVAALSGFTAVVSGFACTPSTLPAQTTCSFSPSQVTGSGSTTLTITTMPLGQLRHRASNSQSGIWWRATPAVFLVGICLIGIPSSKPRRSKLLVLLIIALFTALPSCGGGGSSGGGGGVTNNPVPSISSLSPTQLAAGSAGQTLTINGSGFIGTSSVTFNGISHSATLKSASQLSIQLTGADIASTGTFPVVVSNPAPGGGPSGSVNFDVVTGTPTGNFTVTVNASSGTVTHTTSFTLQVQ